MSKLRPRQTLASTTWAPLMKFAAVEMVFMGQAEDSESSTIVNSRVRLSSADHLATSQVSRLEHETSSFSIHQDGVNTFGPPRVQSK